MIKNLASLCWGDFVIDKIDLKGTYVSCNFGKLYNLGLIDRFLAYFFIGYQVFH